MPLSSEELALIPSIIQAISTLSLVIITIYYAMQTSHLVEESRKESRRGIMLQLTNEIYKPLYDAIKDVEHCILKFDPIINTNRVTDIMGSFWYPHSQIEEKIALKEWLKLVNNYEKEVVSIATPITDKAIILFERRLLKIESDRKPEIMTEFRNNLYKLSRGKYLEKLIDGTADDEIILSFNNFMTKEDQQLKRKSIRGLAKILTNELRKKGVFNQLTSLRDKSKEETSLILKLLNKQSIDVFR